VCKLNNPFIVQHYGVHSYNGSVHIFMGMVLLRTRNLARFSYTWSYYVPAELMLCSFEKVCVPFTRPCSKGYFNPWIYR
jgi:hypothetical protein